jgi:hypothetical protein
MPDGSHDIFKKEGDAHDARYQYLYEIASASGIDIDQYFLHQK